MAKLNAYRAQLGAPPLAYSGGLSADAQAYVDQASPSKTHVGRKWQWQCLFWGGTVSSPTQYLLEALDAFFAEPAGSDPHKQIAFMNPIPLAAGSTACQAPVNVGFAVNASNPFAAFYFTCAGETPCAPNCP